MREGGDASGTRRGRTWSRLRLNLHGRDPDRSHLPFRTWLRRFLLHCHFFYTSWTLHKPMQIAATRLDHAMSLKYGICPRVCHSMVELSIYHSIIFTRRTVVSFSISCLRACIDSICPKPTKHYQDQSASSMKIAFFQLEPHWFHTVQQLRTRLPVSIQWPAVDHGLGSRGRNLCILVMHLRCMSLFLYRKPVMCSFFIGLLDHRSSYTTSISLSFVATIGVLSNLRQFCGFSSGPKLRHLHPNRDRRTLRGEHSATRYTRIVSNCCSRVDCIMAHVSILHILCLQSKHAGECKDCLPVIQKQSFTRKP
jgi:hypothetical protein